MDDQKAFKSRHHNDLYHRYQQFSFMIAFIAMIITEGQMIKIFSNEIKDIVHNMDSIPYGFMHICILNDTDNQHNSQFDDRVRRQ